MWPRFGVGLEGGFTGWKRQMLQTQFWTSKKGKNDERYETDMYEVANMLQLVVSIPRENKTTDQLQTEKSGPETVNLYMGSEQLRAEGTLLHQQADENHPVPLSWGQHKRKQYVSARLQQISRGTWWVDTFLCIVAFSKSPFLKISRPPVWQQCSCPTPTSRYVVVFVMVLNAIAMLLYHVLPSCVSIPTLNTSPSAKLC